MKHLRISESMQMQTFERKKMLLGWYKLPHQKSKHSKQVAKEIMYVWLTRCKEKGSGIEQSMK